MCCSSGYVVHREDFFRTRETKVTDPEAIRRKNLELVETMMAPGVSGSYVDLVKRVGAATPGHAVKAIGQATEEEVVAALAAIQFPSLFLAGELDKTAPPEAIKRNADRVSGSSYAVVEGCGHYPWAESLDTFCGKVEPFLTRFR